MEEKTMKTEKNGNGNWVVLLLEAIFGSVQAFVEGTIESAHRATHTFTRRLAHRMFLFLLAFLGIVFLLIGVAKLLSAMYRFPGAGEAIMGIFILLISLVLYAFARDDR